MTPTLTATSPQGKKRKQSSRETSSLRKSIKVTIKQKKQNTTLIPPPSDDRERDEMAEATLLSLTLHKTALAAEAQENVAKEQEKLAKEDIEEMVKGKEDEESYASTFVDSMLNDDIDDSGTRIKLESHKENPKVIDDDDDTPILTPNRSLRKDLSSDKTISAELTANVSPTTATISKYRSKSGFTSNTTKILPENIAGMCRRHGQICNHIKTKFVTREFFMGKIREVLDHCNNVVPELTFAKTNEMIKEEMPRLNTTLIPPPSDDSERDEMAEATLLSLTLHKTALAAEAQENVAKEQEKLAKEEIEEMVKGKEDEESYASTFVDSMLNDDIDDSGTMIELESHKENPKVIDDDDDVNDKEKQDEKKNDDNQPKYDDVEKTDDVARRKIMMQRIREVLDHYNNVVPELTFAKTNEMIKEEMPRLGAQADGMGQEAKKHADKDTYSASAGCHSYTILLFRRTAD
uniref:Uncharacterized protein n=1 Tax=Tanacetum cinerariifolium TaxID=118510 RepID=A0A6L2LLZ9_TANCI|nr:hypothetical protein [Tanacetum cinerariifolium]